MNVTHRYLNMPKDVLQSSIVKKLSEMKNEMSETKEKKN